MSSIAKILSPLVIIALVVGAVAGLGIEYAITQPTIQQLNVTVDRLEANVTSSRSTIGQLTVEKTGLEDQLTATESTLSDVRAQLSNALQDLRLNQTQILNLQQQLEQVRKAISRLANDQKLLADLRKDVPLTRNEAQVFWEGVRDRAVQVDTSLASTLDKILRSLDAYFNWIEAFPRANPTNEALGAWYASATQGVIDYIDGQDEFRAEALLIVIVHLGQVTDLLT